jgi:hypothetical protein
MVGAMPDRWRESSGQGGAARCAAARAITGGVVGGSASDGRRRSRAALAGDGEES